MTQPIVAPKTRPFGKAIGRVGAPLLCLTAIAGIFAFDEKEHTELYANSASLLGPDFDTDGLADSMEAVLGTSPDVVDSDFDGFHDLEEITRGSDPLDAGSIPSVQPMDIGMYTYVENGVLALHTAIYVDNASPSSLTSLSFELGVVLKGKQVKVAEQTYSMGAQSFFYSAPSDPADLILVLEMPVPDVIIDKLGQLSIYSIVRDQTGVDQPVVDVLNLVKQGSETMQLIPAPASIAAQKGGGVVFRPLTGDGSTPSNSTAGKICWQDLVPVGTNGSAIEYEVERANCEDFDSVCIESDCAAKAGTLVELPDPGRLLGG